MNRGYWTPASGVSLRTHSHGSERAPEVQPQQPGADSLAAGSCTCPVGSGGSGGGAARTLAAPKPRPRRPLPRASAIGCGARLRPAPRGKQAGDAAGQSALRRRRHHHHHRHHRRHRHCLRHRRRHRREHLASRAPRAASVRPSAPGHQPRRLPAEPRAAATTPRAVLRVKNGAAKLPKPPAAAAAEAPGAGAGMERSQSRLSLSASFEALAIYFPCMNSFDDEDAGERAAVHPPRGVVSRSRSQGPSGTRSARERRPLSPLHSRSHSDRYPGAPPTPSRPQESRRSSGPVPPPAPQGPLEHLHSSFLRKWALGSPGPKSPYLYAPAGFPRDPLPDLFLNRICHYPSLVYAP